MADLGNISSAVSLRPVDMALALAWPGVWPEAGGVCPQASVKASFAAGAWDGASRANSLRPAVGALALAWPGVWPNIGMIAAGIPTMRVSAGRYTANKAALGGVVADVPASGQMVLSITGHHVSTAKGSGGHTYFYDLEDGVYVAMSASGATSWRVTVAGAVATVEPILSGGDAPPGLLVGDRLLVLADDGRLKTRPKVV